jgi:hypothetical protein
MLNGAGRAAIALGAVLAATSPAVPQGRGRIDALAPLQPGLWELRELDNSRAVTRSMCIADPNILMQVQHRNSPCSRLVIANGEMNATVHYTCPAGGFGRTTIRVESPRLAVIDTQGIDHNMPFAYRAELRRRGACPRGSNGDGAR